MTMSYRLFGRSGLRVSELALGTMTFGTDWGWGADRDECRKMFEAYAGAGGNFVDTANNYTNGTSERIVGELVAVGASDTPAWAVARAVTLAELRGWTPFCGLQAPWSLADRSVERELLPLAAALGLAVTPWGVLESGELTGKYLSPDGQPTRDNLGCLDFRLDQAQLDRLAAASGFQLGFPRSFLESDHVRGLIFGQTFERIRDHRRVRAG
jgi:aryl-alcohol dehydrogenase-like predicted oxidoreductase